MSKPRASFSKRIATLLVPAFVAGTACAQIPAFPGAEGFGAYARGGRGGDVYIVTNLNSTGAGSLANGIATAPAAGRTIVFAVSGHIHVPGSNLRITQSKITIAGQTAPGDGVGLRDGTFRISGDDIVIRHLRFRHGKNGSGGDCIDLDSGSLNCILDHISMQFSTDENISSFGSPPENLTMQWSLNGWGLESHSCGGLWDQNHATCHHTLWSHNHTRNPKARPNGLLEWVNNVTFDWDIGFIMGDSATPASWKANVVGSYFLSPAGNLRSKALEKANLDRNGNPNFSLYLSNCRHDNDGDGLLDGTDKGYGIASGSFITLGAPVAAVGSVPVTVDDPTVAFKKVASSAGALRMDVSRTGPIHDEVDARMIANLLTQTRNHITSEAALGLTNGGFGTLNSAPAPLDTDKDGMPDFYETALGWNPAAQDHNTALASAGGVVSAGTFLPAGTVAGYTRLEEYLHYKSIPHGTVPKNIAGNPTSIAVDLRRFTGGFTASPTFSVSGISGGTVALGGPGNAIATFTPTLNLTGRAGFQFTVTDAAGHSWTQSCALVITNAGLPRDIEWKGSGNAWDGAALNWLQASTGASVAFSAGDSVAFDDSGAAQASVAVSGTQSPGNVLVDAAANYTLGGTGAIASTGTLTKRGTGTLTLAHSATYSGGIALENGTVALATTAPLGGGPISMLDGSTFANTNDAGSTVTINNAFEIPAGNSATVRTGNRAAFTGAVTGDGGLNYLVQTTVNRADLKGAMAGFAGALSFAGGGGVRLFFNGGSFNGFDAASVDVGGTVSLQPQTNSGGNTLAIGALSGGSATANLAGGSAGAVAYVVGARGTDTTYAGSITGNATLTKAGAGTLTLSGASTFTGATNVNAGALLVAGSLAATPVTVAGGALLGGEGSIAGPVTAGAGAFLSPGTPPFTGRVLALGNNLTLNNSTMYCDLSAAPGGANDRIQLSGGTLAMTGALHFQILALEGSLGAGNYVLVSGAGTSTANTVTLTHNLPAGTRQTFTMKRSAAGANPSEIWLEVLGDPATLTWTGGTNAVWDSVAGNNWTGAVPNTFARSDAVVFNDSTTVNTVSIPAAVYPRSVLVNNSTRAYTLGGTDPAVAGLADGVLTKSGTGTLTLNGTNSHPGGTILKAGTIVLANATANAAALGTGPVTLNGGTLTMYSAGDGTHAGTLPNALIVPGAATLRVAPRCGFSGAVSGNGTLEYFTTYVRADITGNWSGFTGQVNVTSDSGGGDFRIDSDYAWAGIPNGAVHLTDKTYLYHSGILASGAGTTIALGALSGTASSHLLGGVTGGRALTYRIGGKGTSVTFAGSIDEQNTSTTTAIVKTGAGTWTLAGPARHRGATTVEAGTLKFAAGSSLVNDSSLQVAMGATLALEGGSIEVDNVSIASGGSFTSTGGSLAGDFNNDGVATISAGSLSIFGDVVNNGTLRVTGGASLNTTGSFVNHGVLDLLTSPSALPANLDNQGVVVENRERRVLSATKSGTTFSLTVQGYVGHAFQLQRAGSIAGPWTNVGAPKAGAGVPLVFTDAGGATANQCYYRVAVTP